MKKTMAFIMIIPILLAMFTGCNADNDAIDNGTPRFRVHSVSGENEFMEINNGAIIFSDEYEQFVGGDLSFKGEELSGLKDYKTEFYFYLNDDKTFINSSTVIAEGIEAGTGISPYMGATYSETLFRPEVWGMVMDSLHFTLSGSFMDGGNFEYSMALDVEAESSFDYRPMIYVQSKLYGETADVLSILPDNAVVLGTIRMIIPQNMPMVREEFVSNVLPDGSWIYAAEAEPNVIYVELSDGRYSVYSEIEQ